MDALFSSIRAPGVLAVNCSRIGRIRSIHSRDACAAASHWAVTLDRCQNPCSAHSAARRSPNHSCSVSRGRPLTMSTAIPDALKDERFYDPSDRGFEARIAARMRERGELE